MVSYVDHERLELCPAVVFLPNSLNLTLCRLEQDTPTVLDVGKITAVYPLKEEDITYFLRTQEEENALRMRERGLRIKEIEKKESNGTGES